MILPVIAGVRQRGRRRSPNIELQARRINAGLARSDLSRKTGVSVESIRLAEAGFVPGPRLQFALARALDREPLDIWPLENQR